METLKWRCEEQEKLIPSQPESQREQLKQQLQQVRKTLETCNHIGSGYCSISKIKTVFFQTTSIYVQVKSVSYLCG